jgi:hypothetical protein
MKNKKEVEELINKSEQFSQQLQTKLQETQANIIFLRGQLSILQEYGDTDAKTANEEKAGKDKK